MSVACRPPPRKMAWPPSSGKGGSDVVGCQGEECLSSQFRRAAPREGATPGRCTCGIHVMSHPTAAFGLHAHSLLSLPPILCSNALAAVGGTVAGPGSCVVNVYINFEKKFAFVELRTGACQGLGRLWEHAGVTVHASPVCIQAGVVKQESCATDVRVPQRGK